MKKKIKPPKWNSFSQYPPQKADIYIKCQLKDDSTVRHMILLSRFNACTFNPSKMTDQFPEKGEYCNFEWAYKSEVDKFRKSISRNL